MLSCEVIIKSMRFLHAETSENITKEMQIALNITAIWRILTVFIG